MFGAVVSLAAADPVGLRCPALCRQMEAALAAWNARYEAARVQQGYFTTDTEAFAHG